MTIKSVMLASDLELARAEIFGSARAWLVSHKIDGIRCYTSQSSLCAKHGTCETVFARSGKRLPNHAWRALLAKLGPGFDGEIAPANYAIANCFQESTTSAMTQDLPIAEGMAFHIFNYFGDASAAYCQRPFSERMADAKLALASAIANSPELDRFVLFLHQEPIDLQSAQVLASRFAEAGHEGAMLTHADAPYLQRRARATEAHLCKLKAKATETCRIMGMTQERDKHGELKNSLGALILEMPETGHRFQCGSGFTKAQREQAWAEHLAGTFTETHAEIEHMPGGQRNALRMPIFKAYRSIDDAVPAECLSACNADESITIVHHTAAIVAGSLEWALTITGSSQKPVKRATLARWQAENPQAFKQRVLLHIAYWRARAAGLTHAQACATLAEI